MSYHVPVMLSECIDGLSIKPEGIYVDVTFGGGGHSRVIASKLNTGKLYAFDQDADAIANTAEFDKKKFKLIEANFRYIKKFLRLEGVTKVDGILADLGISSHQIDAAERGFSTRFEGALDMRMDQSSPLSAADVVNSYEEKELHKLLGLFGEVTNAKSLAGQIVKYRTNNKITTTQDLIQCINPFAPKGKEFKYYAQVFQALRIEVNQELKVLEEFLLQTADLLNPGGRLVVMSYHSLEDRLVKNYINKGVLFGEPEKDLYGNFHKPFDAVNRKPIEANAEEVNNNPRARSAKLRIAEKCYE